MLEGLQPFAVVESLFRRREMMLNPTQSLLPRSVQCRARCVKLYGRMNFSPPNQRLQLTLLPFGDRPLAVLRGGLVDVGEIVLTSFVRMTPALQRGAAETHNR